MEAVNATLRGVAREDAEWQVRLPSYGRVSNVMCWGSDPICPRILYVLEEASNPLPTHCLHTAYCHCLPDAGP